MVGSRLTSLQTAILESLGAIRPQWTLVGGAALAGFHLGHRETHDLDLFWREVAELGELPRGVQSQLESVGWEVAVLQRSSTFVRLRVANANEVVVVDLVAEPMPAVDPDLALTIGESGILVASPHEILVSKLCSLLGRSEIRDLLDVQALLEAGGDFERAVGEAFQKDGGFSPLTLAWVLRGFDIEKVGSITGVEADAIEAATRFRDELVETLLTLAKPD